MDSFTRWNAVIAARRSRRRYDPERTVPADLLAALSGVCEGFRPFPSARAVLVAGALEDVFKGAVGTYGKIKGAPGFIAFIGDMRHPNVQEQTGYTGEGVVLEATALGLDTCWVGGFFRAEVAADLAGARGWERVLAVTPVGYASRRGSFEEKLMAGFGRHRRRRPLSRLADGIEGARWPDWARAALEAARLAPSAINRQPWGFHVAGDSIEVYVRTPLAPDFTVSKRLDCGIAMLHVEAGAASRGAHGRWTFLEAPGVARFEVQARGAEAP